MAHIHLTEANVYQDSEYTGLAANSLDLSDWAHFLSESSWVIGLATAWVRIVWVNQTQKLYTSDNQTNAKAQVGYISPEADRIYDVNITGGSITVANEQQYFNLSNSVTVDWTTASASTGQVQMIKFVSATNSKFKVANRWIL